VVWHSALTFSKSEVASRLASAKKQQASTDPDLRRKAGRCSGDSEPRRRGLSRAKTIAELGCGGLDGDDTVKTRIPRLPHLPHATRAKRTKDLVGAEFVAGRDRHVSESLVLADQDARKPCVTAYSDTTFPNSGLA